MKNKYTFYQVAECYCNEIGFNDIPLIEEYLKYVFQRKIDKNKLEEYDKTLYGKIRTNSELFPEFNGHLFK